MPQQRLHALQQVLRALVEHPEPGALVVGCAEHELFYLVHLLGELDDDSPADRFFIVADAFTCASDYCALLENAAREALGGAPGHAPGTPPEHRVQALLQYLLADLPAGDHRLIAALVPHEIHDPAGFSALAEALLAARRSPRLRLIVRDDPSAPRHLETAARSASEHIFAYKFSLPPDLILASVHSAANDPGCPPDERAHALVQLACQDLGHGRHADALARCEIATGMAPSPAIQALALAIEADVLRTMGDMNAAIVAGLAALRLAVDSNVSPIVQHAALALGGLMRDLDRGDEAAACFDLAERAAPLNPEVQARARALRASLGHSHADP